MYKILLVDDEALEREALRIIIERGFTNVEVVGEARFGSEAIILDEKLNPDIILMDIKMPGINGIEATYTIKNRNRDKYIIILTAYDEFNFAQNAIKAGANDYLLKPARPEDVIAAINKYIQGEEEKALTYSKRIEVKDGFIEIKGNNREIKKVIEYIDENISESISLEEVAREVGISPFYLSKLFKKETGLNFITYVNMKKMHKAKEYLRNTDETIRNIALDLGYNEPNYFSKVFKSIEGITPSEYRKNQI